MSQQSLDAARSLLSAMGAVEAAKLLNSPIDIQEFIRGNRLDLDQEEIQRLKDEFRA